MIVFAKEAGSRLGVDGKTPVFYSEGEAWEAGDPFVQANKTLFQSEPVSVRGRSLGPTGTPDVERATRRPGEKR